MKKIFIALSVLAVLGFGLAPANAGSLGMPDDAPGSDVTAPFFLASMPGVDYVNTLFTFVDVKGSITAGTSTGFKFHYSVCTTRSTTVYDDYITGTKQDISSTDAQTIVAAMSPAGRTACEVDLDGDGVNDHWAGYIYFHRVFTDKTVGQNSVVGQVMLVSLADGMASSCNLPMREFATTSATGVQTNMLAPVAAGTEGYRNEVFTPDALATMEWEMLGNNNQNVTATAFGLTPRFYIADSAGSAWMFIWKSTNWTSAYDLHLNWYNAEETPKSANLPLPDELNIINVADYLPASLYSGYPKEGWIDLQTARTTGLDTDVEWLGYTWLKAVGSASQSWTVLNPMQRWVDWSGKATYFGTGYSK